MEDSNYIDNDKEYITYTLENGSKYEGEELNGLRHGFGVYTWPDGDRYVGNWRDGERDGFGVYYWPGGDRYEGNYINGVRHGKGTIYYNDGSVLTGEWENGNFIDNKINGENDSEYEGEELNGLRHGFGVYTWASGDRHVGNWRDGERDGFGVYYWPGGDRYEGNFKNSVIHGKGTIYYNDGRVLTGEWENGTFIDNNIYSENGNDDLHVSVDCRNAMQELTEKGSITGTISYREIISNLQDYNLSVEQLDNFYDELSINGIEITDDTSEETNWKQKELNNIYISWDDDGDNEDEVYYEDQESSILQTRDGIFDEIDDGLINPNKPNSTLINMAGLEFYKNNLFRVLGQSVTFAEQDLTREAKKIKKQLKLGIPIESVLSIKLPKLPYEKNSFDENSINNAIQRLRNPELRLIDELFWFWPANDDESRDDGLNALGEADFLKAHRIWKSANFNNDFIVIHNLAVLALYRVLLMESYESIRSLTEDQANIKYSLWEEVYKSWILAVSNDSIWRHLEKRIVVIDHPSLNNRIAKELQGSIMLFLINISTKLALAAARKKNYKVAEKHRKIIELSGLNENIIEKAILGIIQDILDSISDSCDKAKKEAMNNDQFGLKISLSLHEDTKELFLIIKHLLTEESQTYIAFFEMKNNAIHTLIANYFHNICEKVLEESENKPSQGNAIARNLYKRGKDLIGRINHLSIDDKLVENVSDMAASYIYRIILIYYKETENERITCQILDSAFEIAIDNQIKETIKDAINHLSIYAICCFCKTSNASERAAGETLLGRYKTSRVLPGEDNYEVIKLRLPRCPQCKEHHNKKKNNYAFVYSLRGFVVGLVLGLISMNSGLLFVFILFGAGIGFYLGDKKNLSTIRDLHYVNCSELDYQPLNELRKEGWITLKE